MHWEVGLGPDELSGCPAIQGKSPSTLPAGAAWGLGGLPGWQGRRMEHSREHAHAQHWVGPGEHLPSGHMVLTATCPGRSHRWGHHADRLPGATPAHPCSPGRWQMTGPENLLQQIDPGSEHGPGGGPGRSHLAGEGHLACLPHPWHFQGTVCS